MSFMPKQINTVYWRRFFYFAGIYNILGALNIYLTPKDLQESFHMQPIVQLNIFTEGFIILVAVFGIGFILVARDLTQRKIVMLGALEKVSFSLVVVANWFVGSVSWHMLAAGMVDLSFAAFFIAFLRKT
jgi:hypothetical protein